MCRANYIYMHYTYRNYLTPYLSPQRESYLFNMFVPIIHAGKSDLFFSLFFLLSLNFFYPSKHAVKPQNLY
uniref:Uncharacterized protein n=1 Tax=Rhizophora mucronata TaxID=61149 RepID=A0A2P2Q9Z9_RHIMU